MARGDDAAWLGRAAIGFKSYPASYNAIEMLNRIINTYLGKE
jgi:hypothetical protein